MRDVGREARVGRVLLADLIDRAGALGHHSILALIDSTQSGSLALHYAMGFEKAAHLKEVGFKFGRWGDVIYLQRMV